MTTAVILAWDGVQEQQQQQQPIAQTAMDWQVPAAAVAQEKMSQQTARHSSLPEGSQRRPSLQ
jgi:hypothetical protein